MSAAAALFWTALLSFLPISELRGGIPFAVANGIPLLWAFLFASFCNILTAPVCWVFLSTLHRFFYGMCWYKKIFDTFIERARKKLSVKLEKWGWLGIAIFVGIPLPFTGAWTGTLGAWVLGVSAKRTMLAVIIGVLIAGIIVCTVIALGIEALNIFVNNKWRVV